MHRASASISKIIILTLHVYSLVGGSDYQKIRAAAFEVLLSFDNNNRRQSFSVVIIDDQFVEDTENFILELRFDPFLTLPSNVRLSPSVSVVTILDNDDPGMKTLP